MNQPAPVVTIDRHKHLETTVAIIGSGFSGLGMAIQLRRRGRDDFLILEKSHDIGGTWRENTYPGCGCDVPTTIYSYSFEQNPNWSKMWCSQAEIQAYLQRTTDKYDLRSNAVFGMKIVGYEWAETASRWHLRSADGRTVTAQFIVLAIGPLHVPNFPKFNGIESFSGSAFHSAEWDHSVDLTGKKVAVIGTGASAIQFVPIIAEQVGELQLYQRTPPWVLSRVDPKIPKLFQKLLANVKLARTIFRTSTYLVAESMGVALYGFGGKLSKPLEWAGKANIRMRIKDPVLAAKVTPDYRIGCKRILFSPTYYRALARRNAEVITDGIAEVRSGGIVTADGTERAADVIIYATGFHVLNRFDGVEVRGVGDDSLVAKWVTEGFQSHMGITHAGLPNAFMLMGSNTGVIYTSLVFMIEQQIKLVLRAMDCVRQRAATAIQVRREAQDRFNQDIQRRSANKTWMTGGCANWFVDDEGVNRVLWPGYTWQYWQAVRNFDETEYEFTPAPINHERPATARVAGDTSARIAAVMH
jgi:cation diffusion facilitator CzcD-associated flavoprotein CzcO